MPRYHPPKEWLLDFVAGKMPEGFRVVLATHVEGCAHCQRDLQQVQTLGASLLTELAPTELNAGAFERVWQRAQQAETPSTTKTSLREGLYKQLHSIKWQNLGSVRRAKLLTQGPCHLSLMHIKAGARMPTHTHSGNEMTLILSGAYSDCLGRYEVGDVMIADGDHVHAPVASSDEDCLCLVAESAPLRFTSPLMRIFNPLMRWN